MRDHKLKVCPFCGGDPELRKTPLWHGSHGYKNCYEIRVYCARCGCGPSSGVFNTVGYSEEYAVENAIKFWNTRSKRRLAK